MYIPFIHSFILTPLALGTSPINPPGSCSNYFASSLVLFSFSSSILFIFIRIIFFSSGVEERSSFKGDFHRSYRRISLQYISTGAPVTNHRELLVHTCPYAFALSKQTVKRFIYLHLQRYPNLHQSQKKNCLLDVSDGVVISFSEGLNNLTVWSHLSTVRPTTQLYQYQYLYSHGLEVLLSL